MKKMNYTISQVAEKFHIESHTLRYYEKEGIISPQKTERGIRYFTPSDVEQIEMVCCLKSTGMSLKDIKKYFDLCSVGDETLDQRMEIFTSQREHILSEIEGLHKYLAKIEGKIQWYSGYINSQKNKLKAPL
jgi:DNA-binding transcriptional MerR regulator